MLRGAAYAVAGLYKGLGMTQIQSTNVFTSIYRDCFENKKVDPIRKVSGLYFYETMSISLGRSFELYLDIVFPNILKCIADPKEDVRQAAQNALKTIMSDFSNLAIKKTLPKFLDELERDENWRSKFASVEALGNMAFCAPKQISSFLPQIVKSLRDVMNDTHEKVHEAAIQAI